MFEKALCISGCRGIVTLAVPRFNWAFILPLKVAREAGLVEGEVLLHFFYGPDGINFIFEEKLLHVIPHPWEKKIPKA